MKALAVHIENFDCVCPADYLMACLSDCCFDCFLEHGITLLVTQLFVIAIEIECISQNIDLGNLLFSTTLIKFLALGNV